MGCALSTVANADTVVSRCKERRRLMKEAVHSRHSLAASHSDYLRSLRHVGSTLSHFSSFLSLSVLPSSIPSSPPIPPSVQLPGSFPEKQTTTTTKNKSVVGASSSTTTTSSQSLSSSTWNWEAKYPPSPPGSEFFERLNARREQQRRREEEEEVVDDEEESHYSGTSSGASMKPDVIDYVDGGDEVKPRSYFGGSSAASMDGRFYCNSATLEPGFKMSMRYHDFKEIAAAIEDNFMKAASAGEGLAELLGSGREQLDRSFRQLKKRVYHSTSVLSNLSSAWTSRPPLAVRYHLDTAAMVDSGGKKNHCSTLEQLLAWEKKLYKEVKAREEVKIDHEKKLSTLQSQEYKGGNDAKLDKTKASINRLQSLILVMSQAASTTSSAIIKVRDDELAPQLVDLCRGFQKMWRSMNQYHEIQDQIVEKIHGLEQNSVPTESTSELHRQATRDLECAILDWHSSFTHLISFHRSYIGALYAWLKLTFFQVSTEECGTEHYSPAGASSKFVRLCDDWKQALDRLPDTVAAEAIKSFAVVIHSISMKQEEELKIKRKVETYSKELHKKTSHLQEIERKFYYSYSTVGVGIPEVGVHNHDQVFDSKDPLAEKKSEIAAFRRKVEEEIARHTKAIKATQDMTLNNIRTGLPGVFQAITDFSALSSQAYEQIWMHTCK